MVGVGVGEWWVLCGGGWWVVVVVVGGRSQGRVGVRWVLGGVCFEAWPKILPRWYISGHLKILRIISGNIVLLEYLPTRYCYSLYYKTYIKGSGLQ